MAKKKKITEKLRTFYRGPVEQPPKVASDDEKNIIEQLLVKALPLRQCIFNTKNKSNEAVRVQVSFGLSQALRVLKQKRALALFIDVSLSRHLTKYFNHYCIKHSIVLIRVEQLNVIGSELPKFKSLTAFCIANVNEHVNIDEAKIENLPELDKLMSILEYSEENHGLSDETKLQGFLVDKVQSSGKSEIKKRAKKLAKLARSNAKTKSKQS